MLTKTTNKQFVAHDNQSSIANYRTKISVVFKGIFEIFCGIPSFYCTISGGNPNGVLRNPGRGTLL
jgi:hypothetical protein